jgi:hypothetical protein
VSKKIYENKETITWMYREAPSFVNDSGWRIFSGSETQVYLDNPHNFVFLSAEQVIAYEDNINVNLLAPVGSAFEKDLAKDEWQFIPGPDVFN